MNIAISGYGYVGKATEITLTQHWETGAPLDICVQDPALGKQVDDWNSIGYHMVCVPTPSATVHEGHASHNISAVIDAVELAKRLGFSGITVFRSTMSPIDLEAVMCIVGVNKCISWPEFLRQSSWEKDARYPNLSIMGGEPASKLIGHLSKLSITELGDARTACMAKLAINSYLATRTVIAHDLRKACDALAIDYDDITRAIGEDSRIGSSHWQQPGPDGSWGFGGACFPKDTQAMAAMMDSFGLGDNFAKWATDHNSTIRTK